MEVLDKNDKLYYTLGVMHGDIKSTLAEAQRTNGRVTKLESETVPALEKRLNGIENKIAKYLGGIAVVLFLLNLFLPKLVDRFF